MRYGWASREKCSLLMAFYRIPRFSFMLWELLMGNQRGSEEVEGEREKRVAS